jgi:hypothetical protein
MLQRPACRSPGLGRRSFLPGQPLAADYLNLIVRGRAQLHRHRRQQQRQQQQQQQQQVTVIDAMRWGDDARVAGSAHAAGDDATMTNERTNERGRRKACGAVRRTGYSGPDNRTRAGGNVASSDRLHGEKANGGLCGACGRMQDSEADGVHRRGQIRSVTHPIVDVLPTGFSVLGPPAPPPVGQSGPTRDVPRAGERPPADRCRREGSNYQDQRVVINGSHEAGVDNRRQKAVGRNTAKHIADHEPTFYYGLNPAVILREDSTSRNRNRASVANAGTAMFYIFI